MKRCFREVPDTKNQGYCTDTVDTWLGMLKRDVKHLKMYKRSEEGKRRDRMQTLGTVLARFKPSQNFNSFIYLLMTKGTEATVRRI
jgi:hypothetical protein